MLSLEEVKAYAKDYDLVPIVRSIDAGAHTPPEIVRTLRGQNKNVFVLEKRYDSPEGSDWERYAYLGYEPSMEVSCMDGVMTIRSGALTSKFECADPGNIFKTILRENRAPHIEGLPPFTGGLVGYLAYEYINYVEPGIKWDRSNPENFREVDFMLFDKAIVFDREEKKILLIVNIRTDDPETDYRRAMTVLDEMQRDIEPDRAADVPDFKLDSDFVPMFDLDDYIRMVNSARESIQKGETCQIVLTNAVTADAEGSLLNVYDILRESDPTSYMWYMSTDDAEMAMASPETIVQISDGKARTTPLAGTIKRGSTEEEDLANEKELLEDEKSVIEHNMLVDDARNEFGAFSKIGSIKVEGYMNVVRCAEVMHLGSVVTGEIRDDMTPLDAIAVMTPGGVVSGSPKVHGCELINELEKNRRGIYGSSVGYIGFNGDADFCVFIHSAFLKNGKVCVRSGGGIVMDSVPEQEHQECLNKAMAMTATLKKAGEGGEK